MGSLLSQGRRGNFVVTAVNALQNIKGPIVLAGAGKMGGAMLAGWLARGLDARQVAVLEPKPSGEISALAAKGIRLNPSPKDIAPLPPPAVPPKPQRFPHAGRAPT